MNKRVPAAWKHSYQSMGIVAEAAEITLSKFGKIK